MKFYILTNNSISNVSIYIHTKIVIFIYFYDECQIIISILLNIYYVFTGDTLGSLSRQFRMGRTTIRRIKKSCFRAIHKVLAEDYLSVRIDLFLSLYFASHAFHKYVYYKQNYM